MFIITSKAMNLTKLYRLAIAASGFLMLLFPTTGLAQDAVCDLTKSNGGGFTTSIQSVVCNNSNSTHTIVLRVDHNGCGGTLCKALSLFAVQASPGTYSNVSIQVISGSMTYTGIDMGPNLGGAVPFQGFKIDGILGIGNGIAGSFTITYTLSGGLQAEQVSAKASSMLQMASFSIADFTSVMTCNNTGCGGSLTGPDAINNSASTPINTPVNISILTNDIAGSGALVPSSVTFIAGTEPPLTVGVFTENNSGVVTFTPANNYTGTATINYQVCDVNNLCDIATITVTITGSITGPDAVNDNSTTTINTPVNINILTNDIAGSGALVPSSVTFIVGTAPPLTVGVFTENNSGVVTFTPANNYTGAATINYQVCDVNALCDIATITVTIPVPGNDTDGDGCTDDVDDYPADPTRCFDNYFPAAGNGTLAFEDLWPGQGDYDFNDLVCDYRFKTVTNGSNKVVEIFGKFTIKAFGASLHNGFGFQFPNGTIQPGEMSVTGYSLNENYISLNAQGLEAGQTKPTVIVYDDAFGIMPFPGQGIGVNTTPGAPYVTPVMLTVHMTFTTPKYTMSQINISNFNPFIIVGLNRGIEVHLPDYAPTSLADPDYFGKAQDNSIPSQGRYYRTENNLPWAINIYQSFAYPKEKADVVNTYNHFVQWAVSGGQAFPDWYMDKPGYRNTNNIYVP
jgi:LruC domain-containing protein